MDTALPADAELGTLPAWDLRDLYAGIEAPEIEADLQAGERDAKAFAAEYEGKLATLSGAALAKAVQKFEAIDERLSRLMSYAGLLYAGDRASPAIGKFYQSMQERITAISVHLLFFTLEINRLEDADLVKKLADRELARYRPWLEDTRAFRPHQLSDELEKLLHEKHVAGRAAWSRLFDETMADLRFPVDGKDLTNAEAFNLMSSPEVAQRRAAAISIGQVLQKNIRLLSLITNTLAKDKEIEDNWRHYDKPWSARNLSNRVEDSVVEALTEAVRASYPRLSHRYYRLKAKWFGGETLDYWDRNAPLPEQETRLVPWEEAKRTVLDSYARFSPELAAVGRRQPAPG